MKTSQPQKLQPYLIGLGGATLLASTSSAAVVTMNITSISGPNAGVAMDTQESISLSSLDAGLTGTIRISNLAQAVGLNGVNGKGGTHTDIAWDSVKNTGNPHRFVGGDTIDSTDSFAYNKYETLFYYQTKAPEWSAGSYLGFKSENNRYGWLEATWNPTSNTFVILAGAYESVANVGITTPIPEPGTLALLVAGAGGVAALRRRKNAARV